MKYVLILSAFVLMLASCQESRQGGYMVSGALQGDVSDTTKVYLRKSDANLQPAETDSTTISEGEFSFSGEITEPRLYYIFIEGARGAIPLILEEGEVEIKAHVDSLNAAVVSGTPQNTAYRDFLEGSRELARRGNSINSEMRAAMAAQDTANMSSLRDEYFELQQAGMNYEKDFVAENPDAMISALVLNRMVQTQSVPAQEIEALYVGLTDRIKKTDVGTGIRGNLDAVLRTAIGSRAPDFSAPTPAGEMLSLNEVLGKVTLVDFWAAWCRPCRAENPNIVRIYEKYKDKGLSILGVSLDRTEADWKKAIEDDGLRWHHVSRLEYFGEIANLYNVKAIPASFILDENGIIIARDLRGQALEAKIAELLP
ncbi:MAG: redoxin domain-containing protein [Robiginitalea sp.]|jgi:peroxiredoxin|nr:MAG: AhpC/TSA family protein [Flavobacteriaceae bacterium]